LEIDDVDAAAVVHADLNLGEGIALPIGEQDVHVIFLFELPTNHNPARIPLAGDLNGTAGNLGRGGGQMKGNLRAEAFVAGRGGG